MERLVEILQNFVKIFVHFSQDFATFAIFLVNFVVFRLDVDENLSEFHEIAAKYCKIFLVRKNN